VPLKRQQELKAEVKLLTAIYSEEVFQGRTLLQERPVCCGGKVIDLIAAAGALKITFKEIEVGKQVYHLLEPVCGGCGKQIKAIYHLLS
jgi:hypothetical protein